MDSSKLGQFLSQLLTQIIDLTKFAAIISCPYPLTLPQNIICSVSKPTMELLYYNWCIFVWICSKLDFTARGGVPIRLYKKFSKKLPTLDIFKTPKTPKDNTEIIIERTPQFIESEKMTVNVVEINNWLYVMPYCHLSNWNQCIKKSM